MLHSQTLGIDRIEEVDRRESESCSTSRNAYLIGQDQAELPRDTLNIILILSPFSEDMRQPRRYGFSLAGVLGGQLIFDQI